MHCEFSGNTMKPIPLIQNIIMLYDWGGFTARQQYDLYYNEYDSYRPFVHNRLSELFFIFFNPNMGFSNIFTLIVIRHIF